jgi:cysteine desulfurase/selenocysteine lyase
MTSANPDGNGRFPAGTPAFDGPGETMKGQPAAGRPTLPSGGTTSPGEGSVSGLRLPADFQGAHFLDPAFLAGLGQELLAEMSLSMSAAAPAGEALGLAEELPRALPGGPSVPSPTSAMPAPRTGPIDWGDPELFLGLPEEIITEPPTGLPDVPSFPSAGGSEGYYFLPQPTAATGELASKPAAVAPLETTRPFHVESIRNDFPILHQKVHGKPLIWLDNAATTQKPRSVIEALKHFYERDNSNVHRGAHTLAARATDLYETARDKVRRFLGASSPEEIVFVHGATEAINLVAQAYGRKFLGKGDEIVLSEIEHHANIVPWQQVAHEKGAVLRVIPVNDRGEVLPDEYERLLGPRTRLVALAHVSNALGTVLPVRTMIELAHRHGARVLIDGAQSVPHLPVDVQVLDADFYVFSGHKLFGPSGIGVLYGKKELLESMPPWQGGGNMIQEVTFEHTSYQPPPARFEAGTGILAAAIGLGAAIDYVSELGRENIARYEHELLEYGTELLGCIPGLRLIGTAAEKASVLSFVVDSIPTEDMGRYLDSEGIAVRAGHHCAQPTMRRFGVTGTVRPSLAFYNTPAELDALAAAIRKAKGIMG